MKKKESRKGSSKATKKSEDCIIGTSDTLSSNEIETLRESLSLIVLGVEYSFTEGRLLKEEVIYPNGFYSGELEENKRNGIGYFVSTSGLTYHGQWENDYPSGSGILNFKRKKHEKGKYEGGFLNSQFHGYGEYETTSYLYKGEWNMNQRSGQGFEIYKNEEISYQGEFFNDMRHGEGVITTNGLTITANFHEDFFIKGRYEDPHSTSSQFKLYPSKLIQNLEEKLRITIRNFKNPRIKLHFSEGPTTSGYFTCLESRNRIFLSGIKNPR
jgi:hypothetical protein